MLNPLPEPLITAPHQLFHKKGTANLLPLVLPCKVCGSKFIKWSSDPEFKHRYLRVFYQDGLYLFTFKSDTRNAHPVSPVWSSGESSTTVFFWTAAGRSSTGEIHIRWNCHPQLGCFASACGYTGTSCEYEYCSALAYSYIWPGWAYLAKKMPHAATAPIATAFKICMSHRKMGS